MKFFYAGFEVVLSVTGVDGSFCCSYTGDCFCSKYAGYSSAANRWVTIFTVIMQMGVSVAIIQVVFSVVHYAHDCFYCNYAGDFLL